MSNLTDLYISASYYGVVNLSDATEPFASQSEGRIYLHDGVGEPLGIALDYTKRVSIDNGLTVTGSLLLSGSYIHTGSLDVLGDITASGTISGGTASFDTINARKLNITIESSSVIYNSGSNIFGDEPTDTQVLSGSVYIPNLHYLGTSSADTETRIVNLEIFSESLQADFVTDTELSSALEVVTSSLQNSIDTKLDTGSYLTDSSSFNTRINSKLDTSTFTSFSSSVSSEQTTQDSKLTNLINATSSYARLDIDNNFNGSQTITGSVYGNVEVLTIASQTASIDCSLGNFFTVTLPTGSTTHFTATNIQPGQTISVKVATQTNTTASIDSNTIKMLGGGGYVPTQISTEDILTFVTFDSSYLYGVAGSFFN